MDISKIIRDRNSQIPFSVSQKIAVLHFLTFDYHKI